MQIKQNKGTQFNKIIITMKHVIIVQIGQNSLEKINGVSYSKAMTF